jgi:DNA polymerase I
MKKLYLVDVSSMFFRAFYAIRPLSNPAGLPVNALYGFLSMTVKLLREIRPDYMAFCFDHSGDSFRKEIDVRYKANRSEMPADLVPQVPYFRKLSEALGIPCLEAPNFEADDIIGTLTKLGRDHGLEVVIVSSDKDFAQLVKPYVSMYDTMKDVRYDEAGVVNKWGVEPRKMIDYLSIVGDSSDNVCGVKGIGEKGAQKLLAQYESLEDIYAHIDDITGATQKKLIAGKDDAFLSKELVTIICDMPLGVQPEDLRLKPIHRDELAALLAELDFKTFAKTLLGESVATPAATPAAGAAAADGAAAGNEDRTEAGSGTGSEVDASRGALRDDGHIEGSVSHVLNPKGREVGTVAGSANPMNSFVRKAPPLPVVEDVKVAIGQVTEDRYDLSQLAKWLKPEAETWALQTERGSFLAQPEGGSNGWRIVEIAASGVEVGELLNEKRLKYKGFDIKSFAKGHSVSAPEVAWDQMLAAYVIRAAPIEAVQPLFTLYNGQQLPDLPTPTQILSAHLQLEGHLRKKLTTINGEKVLFEIEQPLVPILVGMERAGIAIDSQALAVQSQGLLSDIQGLEKDIHRLAGEVFNIGSTKQLGQILFEKLKLPPGKKTKTGYSTDADVLDKLSADYEIAGKLTQWRELTKLRSTYVESLPLLVNKETGRIHTTFNQAQTTTGRLSSINPNLQNIPIRTERGNQVRSAFVAAPGYQLVSADYSQIELRILAHITNDPGLMRAFESDLDIHTATASEVFDVPLESVTGDMRRKAKAVNFGLAYGQGAYGLAETLRIPRKEATDIITRYFARFSGVQNYMTETIEEAKKKGYVETIFGRRRYLDELYSQSGSVRQFGERAAINAPIQGTASDLVKLAMIKVGNPAGSRMLLQVHDELVFEAEDSAVDEVCLEVGSKMENVAQLKVPLKVNTGTGKDWLSAH